MKSQSNTMPQVIHNLGNGTSHFNHNIVEVEDEDGNTMFNYDQVTVTNPVNRGKVIEALIREKYSASDELALLRQQEVKTSEYHEYYNFVELCKGIANEEVF